MFDLVQFGGGLLSEGQHIADAITVLALQAADQLQPLLDLIEAPGIELDLALVLAQDPYQVIQAVL